MSRTVKTIQLEDGSDLEVYADNCNVCQVEMIFPKAEADRMETLLPFLKEKMEKGSPCVKCLKEQVENNSFNLFSEEDIARIKEAVLGTKNA